ncbi:MAG: hypothetical protein OXQ84_10445 [bacterium]|nr:hypothetical protein [bacterium]
MSTHEQPETDIPLEVWEEKSQPYQPLSGVYALYQRGVLKYIGRSGDCAVRLHHHRHGNRGWLEAKDGWEAGIDFTARVLPEENGKRRKLLERFFILTLKPPCNDR